MKRLLAFLITLSFLLTLCTASCQNPAEEGGGQTPPTEGDEEAAETVDVQLTDIPDALEENVNTLTVSLLEGTGGAYTLTDKTLTFSSLDADTVYSLTGEFDGQIVIDAGDDYSFELELAGVKLYSASSSPITVLSGDSVTVSAKKDTENFIYDTRQAVDGEDEEAHAAAVWADCDLDIQGKGALTVISKNNNGIHTKDTLKVKNVTLSVCCQDNALKGNDGVEISGGILTLIAKTGDGIKTSSTDLSKKGKQRGTVTLTGGTVSIYAACDGIDAAFDVAVEGDAVLNVYTDRYSPYSESVNVETPSADARYIRFTSNAYSFSVKYYNSDTDYCWVNATYYKTISGGRSNYYYYTLEKLTAYSQVQFFIYSSGQAQGQDGDYAARSDYMTWNTAYDTFALVQNYNGLGYNWTNYTEKIDEGMGMGGMGGMQDGNADKGDYSTKGVKADNEIRVSGGTVTVKSYDDALHANSEAEMESGVTPTGNVSVTGGTLTLFSKDDGIHADGALQIDGGTVSVEGSYEGLEGTTVTITGGEISLVSSDDGINATATTGVGISFTGGKVYVYAGGDGVDANSRTSYQGIVFAGGEITIVSTSGGNSSIDTEQGYTYTGGKILAVCPSNGMGSESTHCQNFSSVGTKTTLSLKKGQTVSVKVGGDTVFTCQMPVSLSSLVIYLGAASATIA